MNIVLKSTNIPPAIYQAQLEIESNDPANPTLNVPVTMTVLSNQASILSFSFNEQYAPAVINPNTRVINISVNPGTNVANLVATFSLSDGATATVGGVDQQSGVTVNNYTSFVTYRVLAEDGITFKNWRVNVTVMSGIADANEQDILLYPNPANDKLYIKGLSNGSVTIFNSIGQKMLWIPVGNIQQTIDISLLQCGFYVVHIDCGNKILSRKLQIVK